MRGNKAEQSAVPPRSVPTMKQQAAVTATPYVLQKRVEKLKKQGHRKTHEQKGGSQAL